MTYEVLDVKPMTRRIGAEIFGVVLGRPLSNRQLEELHQALTDYLAQIDRLGPELRRTFQSTLNEGFRDLYLLYGAACLLLLATSLHAQTYPTRPIKLVVPFGPGGSADAIARPLAEKLGGILGQPVVVDYKTGAGGNIAHQYVATGPADGSVLLFGSVGPLAIAPHLMKIAYDPQRDLAPVTMGVNFPNVLVVHSGLKIKTFAEFIDFVRKNPKKLDFASTGAGSASHLAGELMDDMAKITSTPEPGSASCSSVS